MDPWGGTWTYDGKAWTKQAPPTSPPRMKDWSLAYDPAVGHTVLFGGVQPGPERDCFGGYPNDTWTYNGATWTKQPTLTAPLGRSGASMAYAPPLHSLVLFGGEGDYPSSGLTNETWTYGLS
jgi:hypothetical protein